MRDILASRGRADGYIEVSLTSRYRYKPFHNDLDTHALAFPHCHTDDQPVRSGKLRPCAPVAIVTGDVHMQTELELLGLPFVEPPDAASKPEESR